MLSFLLAEADRIGRDTMVTGIHVTASRRREWEELQRLEAQNEIGGVFASALIPTPQGLRTARSLKVGDEIFAADGTPTRILQIDVHHSDERIYAVTFTDGRVVRCSENALWTAYRWTHRKGQRVLAPVLLSLRQILDRGVALHRIGDTGSLHAWRKFHIPACLPLQYEEQNFSVDPYVMGAFIGDGNIGPYAKMLTLSCANADRETVARIATLIGASGYKKNSDKNYNWQFLLPEAQQQGRRRYFHVSDVFADFPEVMHNAGEKSIPDVYRYSSIEQRWDLLRGLMDTDGTIGASRSDSHRNQKKASLSFSTTSPKLANDVAEVVWSLGISAHVLPTDRRNERHKHANGRTYRRKSIEYEVSITCQNDDKERFFLLERKRARARRVEDVQVRRNYRYQLICDIELETSLDDEIVTLVVDNDEHCFLAENYMVMHDTSLPGEIT